MEGNGLPDLGVEKDDVVIDGQTFNVPMPVVNEIVNVRRGATHALVERMKTLELTPDSVICVTTPGSASNEFVRMVGQISEQQFPDHKVAVLPEALGMHTIEGFADALNRMMDVAEAVRDADGEKASLLAEDFIDWIHGRGEHGDAG